MVETTLNNKKLQQIQQLVAELVSLQNPKTISRLLPYGNEAVKCLRDALLNGKPSSVYQARQQLVLALSAFHARDVLLEYLRMSQKIENPVVKFAEEAVQSIAARELSQWEDDEIFKFLIDFSINNTRIGVLDALAKFGRTDAIPIFLKALGDDYYRSAAENGLRKIGEVAKIDIINTAITPIIHNGIETPQSIRCRSSALSLLVDLHISHDDWKVLQKLFKDRNPEIAVKIGLITVSIGNSSDKICSVKQIIKVYSSATPYSRMTMELEECLMQLSPEAKTIIDQTLGKQFNNNKSARERLTRVRKRIP